uniref:Uncharacterized protein n=1 Tax=Phasianus colchicus TaxID=9054 RepID=A0A669Q8D5_PHACC
MEISYCHQTDQSCVEHQKEDRYTYSVFYVYNGNSVTGDFFSSGCPRSLLLHIKEVHVFPQTEQQTHFCLHGCICIKG